MLNLFRPGDFLPSLFLERGPTPVWEWPMSAFSLRQKMLLLQLIWDKAFWIPGGSSGVDVMQQRFVCSDHLSLFGNHSAVSFFFSLLQPSTAFGICYVISPSSIKIYFHPTQPTKNRGFIDWATGIWKGISAVGSWDLQSHHAALCFLQELPFELLLSCHCCWFMWVEGLPSSPLHDSYVAIWDFILANLHKLLACAWSHSGHLYAPELLGVFCESDSACLHLQASVSSLCLHKTFRISFEGNVLPLVWPL